MASFDILMMVWLSTRHSVVENWNWDVVLVILLEVGWAIAMAARMMTLEVG